MVITLFWGSFPSDAYPHWCKQQQQQQKQQNT